MVMNMGDSSKNDEFQLWEASQSYMQGKITAEELEEIEHPNAVSLNRAFIHLALRHPRDSKVTKNISDDDRERYLWMISRRYMAGDLTVEQLEENELPHTQRFNRAMTHLAAWRLWHGFLDIFRFPKKGTAYS
jgi:hypothetical protein